MAGGLSAWAQPVGPVDVVASSMRQFFWALVVFVVVSCVGLLWAGFVRHRSSRKAGEVREREGALEAYYQDLFENSHDLVFTLDLDGGFLSINKAGEETFGHSRAEMSRKPFSDYCDEDGGNQVCSLLDRLRRGESVVHAEVGCRSASGRRVVLDVSCRMQHRDGAPMQVRGMAWDITERRVAEESLRRSEQQLRFSLEERERLGRDLHDGIIQSIYAVGLGLQDCRGLIRENPVEAGERLTAAVTQLNHVIREVRGFIGGLEAEPLDPARFQEILESIVRSAGLRLGEGMVVDVAPDAVAGLGRRRAGAVLQIAREALSNSLRHARAGKASVTLERGRGRIILEVRDCGSGFDVASKRGTGHGLLNMEARAKELGEVLEIRSSTGNGTCVRLELPEGNGTDKCQEDSAVAG